MNVHDGTLSDLLFDEDGTLRILVIFMTNMKSSKRSI